MRVVKFQISLYSRPNTFPVLIFPETGNAQQRSECAEVLEGLRSVKSMIVFDLEASKIGRKEHPHLAVLYTGGAITADGYLREEF